MSPPRDPAQRAQTRPARAGAILLMIALLVVLIALPRGDWLAWAIGVFLFAGYVVAVRRPKVR